MRVAVLALLSAWLALPLDAQQCPPSSGTGRAAAYFLTSAVDTLSYHANLATALRAAQDSAMARGTDVEIHGLWRVTCGAAPVPPPGDSVPTEPEPEPEPPPAVGDTVYASTLGSLAEVVDARIGSGSGASQQGGTFTGSGYLASQSPDRLVIPHASLAGLRADRGTATWTYLPGYDSSDGTVKRDILFLGSWGTPGWHMGKHAQVNGNGLYWQVVSDQGQHPYETLSAADYPAWSAGDVLQIRVTWDASQGTTWVRTWLDGCEVTGIRSGIPAGAGPGVLADSLVIGSRRGPHEIFGQGEVRDLVLLSEPVAETLPCGAPAPPLPPSTGDPELPRALPTLPPAPTRTVNVPAGADLQSAINAAQPGDVLLLAPGATYTGPFTLPSTGGCVEIRGDVTAPSGVRVDTTLALPVLTTATTFHTTVTQEGDCWTLSLLRVSHEQSTASDLVRMVGHPDGLLLDRVWLRPASEIKAGVRFNGANATLRYSVCGPIVRQAQQTNCGGAWSSPGPHHYHDNLVMGGSQGFIFGGAGGVQHRPSDLTIRRNHFLTPASWQGTYHNLAPIEFKDAHRALIEGNVIDGGEFGMLIKSAGQGGVCGGLVGGVGCGTEHVTVRYNIVRNTRLGAFNLLAASAGSTLDMHTLLFHDNLVEDVGPSSQGWTGGRGLMVQVLQAPANLTVRNHTYRSDGHSWMSLANGPASPNPGLSVDNIVVEGSLQYGSLVRNPRTLGGHYSSTALGTVFGLADCGELPVTCVASIPSGAGADEARIAAETAGVVRP